jgi:nucleoid-associated protein YgaU
MPAQFLNRFPLINYSIHSTPDDPGPAIEQVITDILFRVGFIGRIKDYASLYRTHVIRDGDTPEILAEKYYGDPTSIGL